MGVNSARKLGHAYGKSGGCRTFPARRRQNFDPQPPLAGRRYGSAAPSALSRALIALGKSVMFRCADPVPPKFTYLFEGIEYGEFEPEHIVTVDVADKTLLGSLESYGDKTDFAIDHHASCRPFAKETWVEGTAGAAMRAHRAFDSGARRGNHAEDRGLPLYGHFHRYGLLPLPERFRKHVPHRGGPFGARCERRGDQSPDV